MLDKIKISEKYENLLKQPKGVRYYIITGGRGSSKSFSVALWNCLKTFEQNSKTLYTRYTLVSAKKSIIPEFQEKIELLQAQEHFEVNNNEIVNLSTKSSIIFSGIKTSSGNQTANLKSLQGVSCWILDEAEEEQDEYNFDKIDLSIRSKQNNNIVVLILNPSTKEHWIYKRFFESRGVEAGFNGIKDDVCYIHTTYKDNEENLSESYLKTIEGIKANNPQKYTHQILGGWREKAEGVIFTNWSFGKFDDSLPFYYGLDFGYVDPDALVKVAIDEKRKTIYLDELFYRNSQGTKELITAINSFPKAQIIADSAEARLIADIRQSTHHPIRAVKKPQVVQRIKLALNYNIVVTPRSTNIAKELNNYSWSSKSSEAPIDMYNHAADAWGYVVWTYAKKQSEYVHINTEQARFSRNEDTGYNSQVW